MRKHGFTLIELMIVVAILAILASVAVPAYHAYVSQAAHAEAETTLADIATKEESYRSAWNTYLAANSGWNVAVRYNRTPQVGAANDAWVRLGYEFHSELEGGIFGGPMYFRYRVVSNGNSYTVQAYRNTGDVEECASLSRNNRRAIRYVNNVCTD